jgi:hypothetical protein
MVRLTGNLQADYVITVLLQLALTTVSYIVAFARLLLTDYPQVAALLLVSIGAYVSYYIIRNAVSIIVGLVKAILKILVIFTLLVAVSWVYLRGVETFQSDFHAVVGVFSNWDSNAAQAYVDKVKRALSFMLSLLQSDDTN